MNFETLVVFFRGVAQPGLEHSLGVREIGRSNRLTPTNPYPNH